MNLNFEQTLDFLIAGYGCKMDEIYYIIGPNEICSNKNPIKNDLHPKTIPSTYKRNII